MKNSVENVPAVLSRKDAAGYIGIGVALLDRSGVPFIRIGKRILYQKDRIDEWLLNQKGSNKKTGKGALNAK